MTTHDAWAQCTINPTNGGILQNDGSPCTVNNNVTVGFGEAIRGAQQRQRHGKWRVTAHGYGTGVRAETNSIVTVNGPVTQDGLGIDPAGPVTASGLGLDAASGARIVANGVLLQN